MPQITQQAVFTEAAIKRAMLDDSVYQLRDPRYPLYLRFNRARTKASYLLIHYTDNEQTSIKLGSYPTLKPRDLLKQLSTIQLEYNQNMRVEHDTKSTVRDVLQWYLERIIKASSFSKSRRLSVQSIINNHLLKFFNDELVSDLNEEKVDELILFLRSKYQVATVKSTFCLLKAVLKQAKQLKMIHHNPLSDHFFKNYVAESVKPKDCYLSVDALKSIDLSQAKPQQRMLFMMLFMFGTRLGETRQARWSDISFAQKTWSIPASHTKTHKEHVLPLTDYAIDLLKNYKATSHGRYLFNTKKNEVISASTAHAMITRISKNEWTAHDIRKRFRSILADIGIDYYIAESLLNHSKGALDQAYIHTSLERLKREALFNYHCFINGSDLYV